jgi:hypothetical protein
MFEFIKPQAHQIYYDRKVEYINLVEQNNKIEAQRKDKIRHKVSFRHENFVTGYMKEQNELVNLMQKYDIPHPLRGQEFEHVKVL